MKKVLIYPSGDNLGATICDGREDSICEEAGTDVLYIQLSR